MIAVFSIAAAVAIAMPTFNQSADGPAATPIRAIDAPDGATCELHVWPGPPLDTLTEGAVWNNVLNSGFANKGERLVPRDNPLDGAGQIEVMRGINPANALGMPNAQLVVHETPRPRRPLGVAPTRSTDSAAPCYAELSVSRIFYVKSTLGGRTLRTLFSFERYGPGPGPVARSLSWSDTGLTMFPPATPADADSANAELKGAFGKNFVDFAHRTMTQQHPAS